MDDVDFDSEHPVTVHDFLWSWSRVSMTSAQVIDALHLQGEEELMEVARDNGVPPPPGYDQIAGENNAAPMSGGL